MATDPRLYKQVEQVLENQTIFRMTREYIKGLAETASALPAIFQGLSVDKVQKAYATVHVWPFNYLKQLKLTRNYGKINEDTRLHMEGQATFETLVDEVVEFHQVRNSTFKGLDFPDGEDPGGRPVDDENPLNQQYYLLIGNVEKLAAMHKKIEEGKKRRNREKAAAARAKKTKEQAAEKLEVLEVQTKKAREKAEALKLKTAATLKMQREKLKAAEAGKKEAEKAKKELEKQVAALQAQLANRQLQPSKMTQAPAARGTRFVGADLFFSCVNFAFSFVRSQEAETGTKIGYQTAQTVSKSRK